MNKLKELILALGAIIGAILAFLFFKKSDNTVNEENNKVKERLAEKDLVLNNNNNELQKEAAIRQNLKEDMEKTKNEEVTPDNVLDFFNNRK